MSTATIIANASTKMAEKITIDTGIAIPIFYEAAGAGTNAVEAELEINRLQNGGLDEFDARVVSYTGQAAELGTFATLHAALAAALGLTELGSLFTATPAAVTLYVGGTFMVADLSEAAGADAQSFVQNVVLPTEGYQAFKSSIGWVGKALGQVGEIIGFGDVVEADIQLAPTSDGFSAEVSEDTTFSLHETAHAIVNSFENAFYAVGDQVEIIFNQSSNAVQGIIDANGGNVLVTEGALIAQAGGGNDTILRTGELMPSTDEPSIIDGGAGADTISYEQISSFLNGLEINLREGIVTPMGPSWGTPLDVVDNVEHAIGTEYDDRLVGRYDGNTLDGGDGNDILWGSGGTVKPLGSYSAADYGADDLEADSLIGGTGDDTMYAGEGDTVMGGEGADVIYAYNSTSIFGGAGNDTIYAYFDLDDLSSISIDGGGGDDKIYVLGGNPGALGLAHVELGYGQDTVVAGGSATWLKAGEPGDDVPDTFIVQPGTVAFVLPSQYVNDSTLYLGDQNLSGRELEFDGGSQYWDTIGGGYSMRAGDGYGEEYPYTDYITDTEDTNIYILGGALLNNFGLVQVEWTHSGPPVFPNPISMPTAHSDSYTEELDTLLTSYAIAGGGNEGTAGNDSQQGSAGNDLMRGYGGNDTQIGAAGNDTLQGNEGNDSLLGGEGDDTLTGDAGADRLIGGAGADSLTGGADADLFVYLAESDSTTTVRDRITDFEKGVDKIDLSAIPAISGFGALTIALSGSYTLVSFGANFQIRINGDYTQGATQLAASDFVFYTPVPITGTSGADSLVGTAAGELLQGLDGNDTLDGGAGGDTLDGGAGTDAVDYSSSNAAVDAQLWNNSASGGYAAGDSFTSIENLIGSSYADNLVGDAYANRLEGRDGNDTLNGGQGNNTLLGGNGDDLLKSHSGADSMDGGAGTDTADYSGSTAAVTVGLWNNSASGGYAAGDSFTSIENLIGSSYNDSLTGNASSNIIYGMDGNDTLNGGQNTGALYGGNGDDRLMGHEGAHTMDGGAGTDTADYSLSTAGVTVALWNNSASGGYAAGDSFTSIENLIGSAYGDNLAGNTSANLIEGRDGNDSLNGAENNDTLLGGNGDDVLRGHNGADTLTGGAGVDVFSYFAISETTTATTDRITDFENGTDKIRIYNLGFTSLSDFTVMLDTSHGEDRTYVTANNASGFSFYLVGNQVANLDNSDFLF